MVSLKIILLLLELSRNDKQGVNTAENLNKSVHLAEKYGLSSMSMDEITEEVKAVRNAKNRH